MPFVLFFFAIAKHCLMASHCAASGWINTIEKEMALELFGSSLLKANPINPHTFLGLRAKTVTPTSSSELVESNLKARSSSSYSAVPFNLQKPVSSVC